LDPATGGAAVAGGEGIGDGSAVLIGGTGAAGGGFTGDGTGAVAAGGGFTVVEGGGTADVAVPARPEFAGVVAPVLGGVVLVDGAPDADGGAGIGCGRATATSGG
jgi:hypothetical protein